MPPFRNVLSCQRLSNPKTSISPSHIDVSVTIDGGTLYLEALVLFENRPSSSRANTGGGRFSASVSYQRREFGATSDSKFGRSLPTRALVSLSLFALPVPAWNHGSRGGAKSVMSILKLLGLWRDSDSTPGDKPETASVRRIFHQLEQLPPAEARYLAAFAYLLSRAARADLHVYPEETETMQRIIQEHSKLPSERATLVVEAAQTENRIHGATDDFLVTREFDKIATYDQKIQLLDCLYAVAASHASISIKEDNEIRQIASELRVDRRDVIAVRSRYRDHLAVLQDLPEYRPE
jgi:uncharacterized tellurite resistance protein B-like protein